LNLFQIGHNGCCETWIQSVSTIAWQRSRKTKGSKVQRLLGEKCIQKRWSNVRDVEILATLKKLANWPRLEKMVRELHQGIRLVSILYMACFYPLYEPCCLPSLN